jgi:two-component system, OmpR family, sensor histidine kinase KdpD
MRKTVAGAVVAVVATAALVVISLPLRDDINALSEGFAFLFVVVGTVWIGGLWPGILASLLGFACFNYFFISPYNTFAVGKGEDVVMLFAFLGLSVLISLLVTRSDARAVAAEARASELRMQQDLSRALVEPDTGPDRYAVVLRLIVSTFGFADGALFEQPHADLGGLEETTVVGVERGVVATTAGDGVERFPLNVGRRNLGLLVLRGEREPLTASERRILEAFGNQLALLLERDRLLRSTTTG